MKKLLIIFMILALPLTAFSASTSYTCLGVSYPIMVNGSQMTITGTPVMNYNGSTLLPLRAVSEALGVPITWDNTKKQVKIDTIDTKKLAESCVEIYVSKNGNAVEQGSGVLIGYDEILTCNHVVITGDSYKAIYNDGNAISCSLKLKTYYPDVAILTPKDTNTKPVKIGDSDNVKVGDKIYIISSPKEKKNVITDGKVLKLNVSYEGVNGFNTSALDDFGSSGGACFNANGELIGIVDTGNLDAQGAHIMPINDIRKGIANTN